MAFRKRNVAVGRGSSEISESASATKNKIHGVRPSSLSSQAVTSTGCHSLDSLLGGHGGLALGCSLLIEESGTTDFAGALLRFYVAQGLCHGHVIHVVGVGERWIRELPGIVEEKEKSKGKDADVDYGRMKIAWRYEGQSKFDHHLKIAGASPSSIANVLYRSFRT